MNKKKNYFTVEEDEKIYKLKLGTSVIKPLSVSALTRRFHCDAKTILKSLARSELLA